MVSPTIQRAIDQFDFCYLKIEDGKISLISRDRANVFAIVCARLGSLDDVDSCIEDLREYGFVMELEPSIADTLVRWFVSEFNYWTNQKVK